VKGILIDTVEDSRSNPIAIVNGFFSGLARATIFRKDDMFWESLLMNGNMRDHNEGLGVGVDGGFVLNDLHIL